MKNRFFNLLIDILFLNYKIIFKTQRNICLFVKQFATFWNLFTALKPPKL